MCTKTCEPFNEFEEAQFTYEREYTKEIYETDN